MMMAEMYQQAPDGEAREAKPVPFQELEVTRWQFRDGSYLELEAHPGGSYTFHGRIDGAAFDDGGEDFYFPDADALLDFFKKHDLLSLLSAPTA